MLRLPAVFSDHMVLQRNKKISVWGETDQSAVRVQLLSDRMESKLEESVQLLHGEGGENWQIDLPPQKEGGPYQLVIRTGQEQIVFEDVYIGEVWLAGGQSNMEFELKKCTGGEDIIKRAGESYRKKEDSEIRYYQVSRISWVGEELYRAEKENSWQVFGQEGTENWSAVAYFFAEKISGELGCKVGIIGCNWGGTSASCWVSRETLNQNPVTKVYCEEYERATEGQIEEEYLKELEEYKAYQSVFDRNVGEYYQTAENPTWEEALSLFGENRYPGPMGPRSERRPGGLYESMLKRVMPYSIAGFLFYQGEEDDHRPYNYEVLLKTLIRQWRADWKDDNLPFLYVLLPMFTDVGAEDFKNWAFLREAQIRVFENGKGLGLASALEYGEYGNIHPVNKLPVGERLANIALCQVYGRKELTGACYGPFFRDSYDSGHVLHLLFSFPGNREGCFKDHPMQDSGFEIAGKDGVYYPAKAVLVEEGENAGQILLSCDQVEEPVYARYLWTNYHPVKLFGGNGIPLNPFRTNREDGARATGSRQGMIKELYEV
ncbi:MAG: sialate O-acetylesterase [Lachnospiraceae bacterium]